MTDTDLIHPQLGEQPYILIEATPDDSESGFDLSVRAGGGVRDEDELACLLLLVVEQVTGVSVALYTQQVDITRRAAGLPPLSTTSKDSTDE